MRSSSPARVIVPAVLVVLDVIARLSLPGAVLALTHGFADLALGASLVSAVTGAARNVVLGWWTERAIVRNWRALVDAALGKLPGDLKELDHGAAPLLDAVRDTAVYEAQAMPRAVALAISAVAIAVVAVATLGSAWLALGAISALLLGGLVLLGQARLRRAHRDAWTLFVDVARDAIVLIEAAGELRAHGREAGFARSLLSGVDRMARKERFGIAWQVVLTLLPASLAVASVAAPFRAGLHWAVATLGSAGDLANLAVLGGAGLATGTSLAQAAEQSVRAAPLRKTLADFLAAGGTARPPAGGSAAVRRSLAQATIAFEDLSCVYPGATQATPRKVSHVWSTAGGLAVSGANGAGKSTVASMLIGLLEPTGGRVTIDGVALTQIDLADYRRRVSYLPQSAFVAPGESVAWHLRLVSPATVSDEQIDAALEQVGLLEVLRQHGRRAGKAPREVLAGELSGGERQRMHLCRALLTDAELVVVDEPEVGLDRGGRDLLRALLERLATTRRVVVIAHDESTVPASFERLLCERGPVA